MTPCQPLAIAAAAPKIIPTSTERAPHDRPAPRNTLRSPVRPIHVRPWNASIPIEHWPKTEPLPSRDFVPWRFSDASRAGGDEQDLAALSGRAPSPVFEVQHRLRTWSAPAPEARRGFAAAQDAVKHRNAARRKISFDVIVPRTTSGRHRSARQNRSRVDGRQACCSAASLMMRSESRDGRAVGQHDQAAVRHSPAKDVMTRSIHRRRSSLDVDRAPAPPSRATAQRLRLPGCRKKS